MKRILVVLGIIFCLTGCAATSPQVTGKIQSGQKEDVTTIKMDKKFRAWQGVASDGKDIFITSDRDEDFKLSNTITVYSKDGVFKTEKTDAYMEKDEKQRFMSFGDCAVIDGYLFASVYNFNASPPENERISRIVKYSLPDLKQLEVYNIGNGTAESVTKYKDTYWVVYHDRNEIQQFNANFKMLKSYPLSTKFAEEGGYQGIFFDGDELYGNLHGSNEYGQKYAQGLDHYHFDGTNFKFVEQIMPPTYGAGQGIEKVGRTYFWADRPGNSIIITSDLRKKIQ
jgi:hypothetical protein